MGIGDWVLKPLARWPLHKAKGTAAAPRCHVKGAPVFAHSARSLCRLTSDQTVSRL